MRKILFIFTNWGKDKTIPHKVYPNFPDFYIAKKTGT